jgi:hypothetical protein
MGRTAFRSANKAPSTGTNTSDIPKLRLVKDEKARIVLLEDPVTVWYHRLRAPKVINGVVQKVEKESRKGGTYSDYEWEFISAPRCLGDSDTLQRDGSDSEHCPMCAAARDGIVDAPKRRHAMTIVKYGTKKNGDVITPFSASVVAWVFADQQFDRIVSIAEELKSGEDLRRRDLVLGPCSDETFQKFDITASERCAYLELGQAQYVTDLFENNKFEEKDLLNLAAWESSRMKVNDDLEKIRDRWNVVNGASRPESSSAADSMAQNDTSLQSDLSSLLDTQTGGVGKNDAWSEPAAANGGYEPSGIDEFAPKETEKSESSGAMSFDDLLA